MNIFLYAPDDFKNLCVIARSLECFGFTECFVFDPNHLIRPAYGKSYSSRIRTVSAGAFFLIHWNSVADPAEFLRRYAGRRIAAVPAPLATPLHKVVFQPADIVIFGSERKGIPPEVQALCELSLTIPVTGRTQSLNLSVAVSIVLAAMTRGS